MPDIVVHNAMGMRVLSALPETVRASVDPEIFRVAVNGPDELLFYRYFLPPFRHGIDRRAGVMHTKKTGEYLMALADRCEDDGVFSFLAGFLCHYALDAGTHPHIIEELGGSGKAMHAAVEHRLDVMELDRQGKDLKDRPITRELFPGFPDESLEAPLDAAAEEVYGWKDFYRTTRASWRHMKTVYRLIEDPRGIMDRLFGWMGGVPGCASYRCGRCRDLDSTVFDGLVTEAVEDAVRMVSAAAAYREGGLDRESLRKIVGDRSYITGIYG